MVLKERKKAFGPQIGSQSKVSESQESSDKGCPLKKKRPTFQQISPSSLQGDPSLKEHHRGNKPSHYSVIKLP